MAISIGSPQPFLVSESQKSQQSFGQLGLQPGLENQIGSHRHRNAHQDRIKPSLLLNNSEQVDEQQKRDWNESNRFHEDGIEKKRDQHKDDLLKVLFSKDRYPWLPGSHTPPCPDEDDDGHDD